MTEKKKKDDAPMPPAPKKKVKEEAPVVPPAPPAPPTPPVEVQEAIEPAAPVDTESGGERVKSPVAAAILALVPFGLGHLYLGQYSRAIAMFAAFWIPMMMLELPLVAVFFYFFAIFDAFRQAQLINLADARGEELPASTFSGGLTAGVFLIVLGAVLILNNWFDLYFIRQLLHDWWPALLIILGAWFIYGAIRERQNQPEEEYGEY